MLAVQPTAPLLNRVVLIEIKLSTVIFVVGCQLVFYVVSEIRSARYEKRMRTERAQRDAEFKKDLEASRKRVHSIEAESDAVTTQARKDLNELKDLINSFAVDD